MTQFWKTKFNQSPIQTVGSVKEGKWDIDLTFLSSVTEEFIKQMVEPPMEQDQIMSHQTKLAKELQKQVAVNEENFTSDTDPTSSSEEEVDNGRDAAFETPLAVSHVQSNQQV